MFEMQTDSKCSNSYKKTHNQRSKNTQKRSQETQFHTIAMHTWLWNDRLTFVSHKYHFSFTNAFFFVTDTIFSHKCPFFYLTNTTRKEVVNFHPACATDMPGAQDTETNAGIILRFFFIEDLFGAPIAVSKSETYPRTRTKGV